MKPGYHGNPELNKNNNNNNDERHQAETDLDSLAKELRKFEENFKSLLTLAQMFKLAKKNRNVLSVELFNKMTEVSTQFKELFEYSAWNQFHNNNNDDNQQNIKFFIGNCSRFQKNVIDFITIPSQKGNIKKDINYYWEKLMSEYLEEIPSVEKLNLKPEILDSLSFDGEPNDFKILQKKEDEKAQKNIKALKEFSEQLAICHKDFNKLCSIVSQEKKMGANNCKTLMSEVAAQIYHLDNSLSEGKKALSNDVLSDIVAINRISRSLNSDEAKKLIREIIGPVIESFSRVKNNIDFSKNINALNGLIEKISNAQDADNTNINEMIRLAKKSIAMQTLIACGEKLMNNLEFMSFDIMYSNDFNLVRQASYGSFGSLSVFHQDHSGSESYRSSSSFEDISDSIETAKSVSDLSKTIVGALNEIGVEFDKLCLESELANDAINNEEGLIKLIIRKTDKENIKNIQHGMLEKVSNFCANLKSVIERKETSSLNYGELSVTINNILKCKVFVNPKIYAPLSYQHISEIEARKNEIWKEAIHQYGDKQSEGLRKTFVNAGKNNKNTWATLITTLLAKIQTLRSKIGNEMKITVLTNAVIEAILLRDRYLELKNSNSPSAFQNYSSFNHNNNHPGNAQIENKK